MSFAAFVRVCKTALATSAPPSLPADFILLRAGLSHSREDILHCINNPAAYSGIGGQQRQFSTHPAYYVSLNSIAPAPGATKQGKRVGRGTGGGIGKTCRRGSNGQKARKGNGKPGLLFDGGQKSLYKFPKHYANPSNLVNYDVVNVRKIMHWISRGKLDASKVITMKELRDSGCASKQIKWGVKLLGGGPETIDRPLHLQVSSCSAQARSTIEAAGGSVTTVFYNQLGLRALLKPWSFAKKDRPLPGPVRAVPPRMNGMFDAMGQLPPPTSLPAAA